MATLADGVPMSAGGSTADGAGWQVGFWCAAAAVGVVAILAVTSTLRGRRRVEGLRRRVDDMVRAIGGEPTSVPGGEGLKGLGEGLEALDSRVTLQARELAKKSRNLESLLDTLDEPVIVTDRDDKVLLCNAAAEGSFGGGVGRGGPAGRSGLVGRSIREFMTSDRVLGLHGAAKGGVVQRGEARIITSEGPRVYSVSAAPLPPAWGEGVFGVVLTLRDVTELAQAGTMRTEFVANASHELRTPVAAIRAAVETIEDGGQEDPALLKRILGMIASHSRRLEDMTRDLMDLSRLESTDIAVRNEPLDWAEIERTLREIFDDALAARGLTIAFDIGVGLTPAGSTRSDTRLLLLILRNLVDNATKYAREGTEIRVIAALAPPVSGGGTSTLRVEVIDEGVGIPLEHQERVFERFYQVDPARTGTGTKARRGTGLGLAIVKHAAKALGGTVGLESVWGTGTRIWAEVPVERGGSQAAG